MAFIKAQKVVRDGKGVILSGSASLVSTDYVRKGSYHARHKVLERLGKVIWLSEDGKTGVFLSPTRGLVEYDSLKNAFAEVERSDERLAGREDLFPPAQAHTMLGDSYMLLKLFGKSGMADVLRTAFPEKSDYERVLCHMTHGILKDGSEISCEDFIARSFASYVLSDVPLPSLKCDSGYYAMMGKDETRMSFFKALVSYIRTKDPGFGRGCYVDSTPLPNDIMGNPFNALCCHGVSSSENMARLVLVLDERYGLPVWYDIIPGNVLDINTLKGVITDVRESLDIDVDSIVVDAGYVSKELLEAAHIGTAKKMIGRMPARKGFPFKELYWEVKSLIPRGKYRFVRNGCSYFGYRKEIEVFGQKEYAYVYVDINNADRRFAEYLEDSGEEFDKMKDRDKDWMSVRFGFFVLISNRDETPKDLLVHYFGRCDIEKAFKTAKEYLEILPLEKWTDLTVRGKILHDIMDTIAVLGLRKAFAKSGRSLSDLFGKTSALMCFRSPDGTIHAEAPSKQVKEYYGILGIDIPKMFRENDFRRDVLKIGM